jgi:hypothetical protein
VLDLLVHADGEEAEDVLREPHLALDLGDRLGLGSEEEVVVGRLGLLPDRVGETAAAHRLVLLEGGTLLDEELAELLHDGESALLVLVGDDQEDEVVLALWGNGGR